MKSQEQAEKTREANFRKWESRRARWAAWKARRKGNMKTQHTFSPMEFAQWFDKHDVHHAVTVLRIHNMHALIHFNTGIELSDEVVKWVPIDSLIPMIGA